jgi:hypothetical protein
VGAAGGAAARAPIVASISNNVGGGDVRLGGGSGGHVGGGGRNTRLGRVSGGHVGGGARRTTVRLGDGGRVARPGEVPQRPVRGTGEGIRQHIVRGSHEHVSLPGGGGWQPRDPPEVSNHFP